MKRQKKKITRLKKNQTQAAAPGAMENAGNDDDGLGVNRRTAMGKLRNWAIGLAVLGGGGWYTYRDVQATMREQDLSRVGNGQPTIVQVHDPQCPKCQALQRNTRNAICELGDDSLQFLVANIRTEEGARFAAKHGVPHITLLFLDGKGKRQTVLSGVHEAEYLLPVLKDHVRFYGPKKG